MDKADTLNRFVSNVSAMKLSGPLGINVNFEKVQNWEIECASGDRTPEFVDYYEQCHSLTEDDKFALMALIVASFDDWVTREPGNHPLRGRLRDRLTRDFAIQAATIKYSFCCDETKPHHVFKITPFMREIWCSRRPRPEVLPG